MRAPLHGSVELELEAEGIGEVQRAALERALNKAVADAVLGKERARFIEVALVADLESEPRASRTLRFAPHHRLMLGFLAAKQKHRTVVLVLDVKPDDVFVECTAGVEFGHGEHG